MEFVKSLVFLGREDGGVGVRFVQPDPRVCLGPEISESAGETVYLVPNMESGDVEIGILSLSSFFTIVINFHSCAIAQTWKVLPMVA